VISVVPGLESLTEANAFYAAQGRGGTVEPNDTLVIARDEQGIAGIVRLCRERGFFSLRTMQVRVDRQRQGLGQELLQRFDEHVRELGLSELYCMPYAHLEGFYGRIGFQRMIDVSKAPEVLWNRYDKHCNRKPNSPVILMKRSGM